MKSTDQGTPSMYGLLVASHRSEPARSPQTARSWQRALGWTAVAIAVVLLVAGCAAAPACPGTTPARLLTES